MGIIDSIFTSIGKGIVLGLQKTGLGFISIFKSGKLFRGVLGVFFLFILVASSVQQSIEKKDPMIAVKAISEFFFLIDKNIGDTSTELKTNGLSFLGILALLGSLYMMFVYTKWIYKFLSHWFGEGISSIIVMVSAFMILWFIQLIWSLIATFALKIEPEFYFPFTGLFHEFFWNLIINNPAIWEKANTIVQEEKGFLGGAAQNVT